MKQRPQAIDPANACPVCGGLMLLLQPRGALYCPAEDPHPGGLVRYPDGRLKYKAKED